MDKEREAFDKWYGIKPKGWFEAVRYNMAWKAWQDAMVILNDLEQAMKEPAND